MTSAVSSGSFSSSVTVAPQLLTAPATQQAQVATVALPIIGSATPSFLERVPQNLIQMGDVSGCEYAKLCLPLIAIILGIGFAACSQGLASYIGAGVAGLSGLYLGYQLFKKPNPDAPLSPPAEIENPATRLLKQNTQAALANFETGKECTVSKLFPENIDLLANDPSFIIDYMERVAAMTDRFYDRILTVSTGIDVRFIEQLCQTFNKIGASSQDEIVSETAGSLSQHYQNMLPQPAISASQRLEEENMYDIGDY